MVIIKNIVAKRTMDISTKIESKYLVGGEPMIVRFSSENEFQSLLGTGLFVESFEPAPKTIQGPKIINPPVKNEDNSTTNIPEEVIVLPSSLENVSDSNILCKECGGIMVPITDDQRPNINIVYCPKCTCEIVIGEFIQEQPVDELVNEKSKRVFSKCPICGKRKAAAAQYCKKCAK